MIQHTPDNHTLWRCIYARWSQSHDSFLACKKPNFVFSVHTSFSQEWSPFLMSSMHSYTHRSLPMQLGEVNLGNLVPRLFCSRTLINDSTYVSTLQNNNTLYPTPQVISDGQFCVQAAPGSPVSSEVVHSDSPVNATLHKFFSVLVCFLPWYIWCCTK